MTYFTIADIKKANRENGYHFFERATLRFFNSRIYPRVYGCKYFITSEREKREGAQRRYTVRMCGENGDISTVSKFMQYGNIQAAQTAAKEFMRMENCERWQVVSLDVLGNKKSGYEVNAAYYTTHYIDLPKDKKSDKEVIRMLRQAGVIQPRFTAYRVEWHDTYAHIYRKGSERPMYDLQLNKG